MYSKIIAKCHENMYSFWECQANIVCIKYVILINIDEWSEMRS